MKGKRKIGRGYVQVDDGKRSRMQRRICAILYAVSAWRVATYVKFKTQLLDSQSSSHVAHPWLHGG